MADSIPFQEAIDFLAGKVNLPTRRYDDLKAAAHVRAFSVAGVTRDDMLTDFRNAIAKAERDGTGFDEFRRDFDAIVDRTGWKFTARGDTEEERRAWRARIIYTTNLRSSYMAGRWTQLMDPDVLRYRPYLQYIHSGAEHPRKMHLSWNGMVLLATDPAWKIMYPQNGWGCGCDVEALSERELKALGKSGPDPSPDMIPYEGIDPRTGEKELRYRGIDRGWEYNVGEEWLHGLVPPSLRNPLPDFEPVAPAPVDLPAMPPATTVAPAQLLGENLTHADYVDAFLAPFSLKNKAGYYRDRSGGLITVSDRMFEVRDTQGQVTGDKSNKFERGRYMKLLADAIINPDEIWVDWAQVTSGVVLRRSYLKQFLLPNKRSMFVRFEWTSKGWVAVTGFDTRESYIAKFRRGAMLYARK